MRRISAKAFRVVLGVAMSTRDRNLLMVLLFLGVSISLTVLSIFSSDDIAARLTWLSALVFAMFSLVILVAGGLGAVGDDIGFLKQEGQDQVLRCDIPGGTGSGLAMRHSKLPDVARCWYCNARLDPDAWSSLVGTQTTRSRRGTCIRGESSVLRARCEVGSLEPQPLTARRKGRGLALHLRSYC